MFLLTMTNGKSPWTAICILKLVENCEHEKETKFIFHLLLMNTKHYEMPFILLKKYEYRISSVIRQEFFSVQTIPKDLDPSCKTDKDLWGC